MDYGRRDSEPRVPDADGPSTYFSFPALKETLGDPGTLLIGPEEPSLDSLVTSPATMPGSVISYAIEGEDGLSRLESIIRSRADQLNAGKISKFDTYYLPQSVFSPGLWEYKCGTCRFYNERRAKGNVGGTCDVVGQDGDPFGGERIHPDAWCASWLPEEGRSWLEWGTDRLEGGGSP